MELLKYIILGLLQGFTEPLPISSSGHIYLFKTMFNTKMFNDLSLEIFLNFASFIAILIIFREDVLKLFRGFFHYIIHKDESSKNEFKYSMLLILGTIPVGIVGLLFKDPLEELLSLNVFFVGIGFFITGIFLLLASFSKKEKDDLDITWKDAFVVGLFQAIAIIPGISRSGMTLVGSLLCGMKKETALKYSFMLYLPVSVATIFSGIRDINVSILTFETVLYYLVGMVAAGSLTYLSYNLLTRVVERGRLWRFSIYLFAVSLFSIMFFL